MSDEKKLENTFTVDEYLLETSQITFRSFTTFTLQPHFSLAETQIPILVVFRSLTTTWIFVNAKEHRSVCYSLYLAVLVSAGIELIFFLEAGTGLCCGFRMRIKLIRH